MNVDRTQRRHVEQRLGQNLAVRSDRKDVRGARRERRRRVPQRCGLPYLDTEFEGRRLYGRRLQLMAAPRGPVGLRYDERALDRTRKRAQRGNGERGRPEKDAAQSQGAYAEAAWALRSSAAPSASTSASASFSSSVWAGRMFFALSM